MEQRLKKQRGRLFLRVALILFAVWLATSATYCVIRLGNEKTDMQRRALSDMSRAKQIFSMSEKNSSTASNVYLSSVNLIGFKDIVGSDFDSQLIVMDPDSGDTLADTAGKIMVSFSFRSDAGSFPDDYGYIDYGAFRASFSDAQYARIADLLGETRDDGRSNHLVCTKFYISADQIVPMEVAVMPLENADEWFDPGKVTETFSLHVKAPENGTVYYNAISHINIIPNDFLLNGAYNRDFISDLSEPQRETSVLTVDMGKGDYLFYSSEYYFLDAFILNRETQSYENVQKLFVLQYAKKANILASCGKELAIGTAVILAFFFTVGTLIFLMIWNTVRTQMIQEQRRLDLTNALAHDIKTPLFVISGYAYTLKENIDGVERDAYLDKIILQTEQINALVHKMLNLSKLNSFGMTLNRSEFDLFGLVQEICDDYVSLPDGKTLTLTHSGDSAVNGDRELLRTALQNLIENAVKYSLNGSGITVDVSGRAITVSNPSAPLSRQEIKKIWQPYYRVDKSRHKKGNGLGLSIVKSILDLHAASYEMSMKDGNMVFHGEL